MFTWLTKQLINDPKKLAEKIYSTQVCRRDRGQ